MSRATMRCRRPLLASVPALLVLVGLALLAAQPASAAARASREPLGPLRVPSSVHDVTDSEPWELPGDDAGGNCRPLIGILTQPLDESSVSSAGPRSYLAASYVKFVEAGGARAVPVRYDAPPDEIMRIFAAVNGLLLPGGHADVVSQQSKYRIAGQRLLNLAIEVRQYCRDLPLARCQACFNWSA